MRTPTPPRLWTILAIVTFGILLAGCTDGGTALDTETVPIDSHPLEQATPNSVAASASSGCGSQARPGLSLRSITRPDGTERTYRLALPRDYDGSKPLPLVLSFHALGASAKHQAAVDGLELTAFTGELAVVHPEGTTPAGLGGPSWNALRSLESEHPALAVDDVGFVDELLDLLESELCLDTNRVWATGFSIGAMFSARLACEMPDRIAAAASVAALLQADECEGTTGLSLLHIHGDKDEVTPFDGGHGTLTSTYDGAAASAVLSAASVSVAHEISAYAKRNGCDPAPDTQTLGQSVESHTYRACADNDLVLYVVHGAGHTWPTLEVTEGTDERYGATSHEIDATQLALEWFNEHPLKPRPR